MRGGRRVLPEIYRGVFDISVRVCVCVYMPVIVGACRRQDCTSFCKHRTSQTPAECMHVSKRACIMIVIVTVSRRLHPLEDKEHAPWDIDVISGIKLGVSVDVDTLPSFSNDSRAILNEGIAESQRLLPEARA